MRFSSALALSVIVAGLVVASHAEALPVAGNSLSTVSSAALPVVQVHGCHFDMGPGMEPDRANGPHYHNQQCAVVRVGPRGGYGAAPEPRYAPPPPPRYDARPRGYGYDGGSRRDGYRGEGGYGRGYGYAPPRQYQPVCRERCRYTGPIKRCRTVCD